MKILLIDTYDSFVHIIDQYLRSLGAEVDVVRNDKFTIPEIESRNYNAIFLGPGPGHPKDCGYVDVIHHFMSRMPIFGICLGLQAIVLAIGGDIAVADHIMHGKTSLIEHTNEGCFQGLPSPLTATRYHSLIVSHDNFPIHKMDIIATSLDDGYIMGARHKHLHMGGVQFHPESIGTEYGMEMLKNFLKRVPK